MIKQLINFFRKFAFKLSLKFFKKDIKLKRGSKIGFGSRFEGSNVIGRHTIFMGYIGHASFIGDNCNLSAKVGKYTSIGHNIVSIQATHPIRKFVSTHPAFYSILKQCGTTFTEKQRFNEFRYADPEKKYGVIIGNDVWIGNGVTLLGGITVGDGAIILANATVTKNVLPYKIVGGIPAKEVDQRFDDSTVNILLATKWWDFPPSHIKNNIDSFEDIKHFIENLNIASTHKHPR